MTRRRRHESKYQVLGLDPSLNGTGICLPNGECNHMTLNTNKVNRVSGMSRLARIAKWVEFYLQSAPTHVCMEGYAMMAKGRTHDKAELHSILKLLVLSRGIPIIVVPPTSLKLWTTGYGFADKDRMILAVNETWEVSISNDDEADAYALMQFGRSYVDRSIIYKEPYRSTSLDKAGYLISTRELQTLAILTG